MNVCKKITNKFLSVVLSVAIIVQVALTPVNFTFAVETSNAKISKKIENQPNFGEKHPTLMKVIKYLGITAGAVVTTVATYYAGRFILDQINPDRVIDRNEKGAVKQRLKVIDRELLNFELGRIKFNAERVKELRETRALLDSRVNSESSYFNAKNAAFRVAGVGGALTIAKCGMDIVNSLGQFSKNISNISQLRWVSSNFINMYKETSELLKPQPKGADKESVLENFDRIFEDFYGQKEAVSSLKNHLYDIVVGKDQAKWKGEKYSRCDIIYLYGPSGVGKSFIAKRLPHILLTNSEPLIMSSADVDKEKKETVVNQLFNSVSQYSDRMPPTKLLIRYLKNNPGGVVIFEEYDKVCTPALNEIFRTAIEQGTINIDGERIECFGTTFIFTSNEDDISMEGFEKSDEEKIDKQSLSEGYTRVWHSKSFLNRIKKVKFKNLTAAEYADILRKHFYDAAAYWASSKNAGIMLTISDKTIETLSREVEKINQGARPIDLWIIPEIQTAIGNIIKSAPNYDFYRNKILNVSYDERNKKLRVNYESEKN
ncbi:MAG: AAA family ATPase [Oscillospiraceae bacterium]|jgi:ATP-dependent Clp protease ATP-binding subunit ClpA|nr:AAA family ATPase [Oscillospiraceae bacterium]